MLVRATIPCKVNCQGWYGVVPLLFLEISILHNDKVDDEYFLSSLLPLKNQILSKRNKFKCHLDITFRATDYPNRNPYLKM